MFMSSSIKAAIHLGPNYLANLEVHKNTNFEEIQSLFNMTQKLILGHSERDSECEYDWKCISFMDKIGIVSWSSDPVDKFKSTCPLRSRSMLGKDEWKQRCNYKMGRSNGRIQNVSLLSKNCWESMDNQWNASGSISTGLYIIADSSRDSE